MNRCRTWNLVALVITDIRANLRVHLHLEVVGWPPVGARCTPT